MWDMLDQTESNTSGKLPPIPGSSFLDTPKEDFPVSSDSTNQNISNETESLDLKETFPKTNTKKATLPLIISVFAAVFGYSFQLGYHTEVLSIPSPELKDYFFPYSDKVQLCEAIKTNVSLTPVLSLSPEENCDELKEEETSYRDFMVDVASKSFIVAAMIGSLLIGTTIHFFSRFRSLQIINFLSILTPVLMRSARANKNFGALIMGRILIGLFAGLSSGLVPIYISEISPTEWRGACGTFVHLLIIVGVLVAEILKFPSLLGAIENWLLYLSFGCFATIIPLVCWCFMSKSPRSLLIDRGKEVEACETLIRLRGTKNIRMELSEIQKEAVTQGPKSGMSLRRFFNDKNVRLQIISIVILMTALNFSGINAILFNFTTAYERVGMSTYFSEIFSAFSVSGTSIFSSLITVYMVEKVGRRALLQWGYGTMAGWCLALALTLRFSEINKDKTWISYLSVVCLYGYVISFSIGPAPIPWILSAELFQQAARPPGMMLACFSYWTGYLIMGLTFPSVTEAENSRIFIGFMVTCVLTTIYVTALFPETKGKTYREISVLFKKMNLVRVHSQGIGNVRTTRNTSISPHGNSKILSSLATNDIDNIVTIVKMSKGYNSNTDENVQDPERIYNMDESGISVVQKMSRVLAKKGKHQVGSITSQERGETVTVICCTSAAGHFIPPGMIFPRVRMKVEFTDGAPPGTMFACRKKGWINCEVFCDWLEHFIKHTKPSKEEKVLLVLDGHKSHTHNLKALERASECGVIMLSLPPHTSHRMQPLDLTFFKPLKTYYSQQIDQWLRAHPGRAATLYQISHLFGLAYGKAANVRCAVSGFRKSGIFPVNPLVFDASDFQPADVTDRPNPTLDCSSNNDNIINDGSSSQDACENVPLAEHAVIQEACVAEQAPGTSDSVAGQFLASSQNSACDFEIPSAVSVVDISPLPKRICIAGSKRRKSSKAAVLTDSPHKNTIRSSKTSQLAKKRKKNFLAKKVKRNLPTTSHECILYTCLVCGESNDEDWIRCCRCLKWAHEDCANIMDARFYYCDNCLSNE